MKRLFLVDNYVSKLDLMETEIAIKYVKDIFEQELAKALNLTRVSAPLFVFPSTGLNDELSGSERRVSFGIKNVSEFVEIVQSLAKWKRNALAKYKFAKDTGLYTDMNAIRRDEDLDSIHSAYVDQWDWEMMIDKDERNMDFLKETVRLIYNVLLTVEDKICNRFPVLNKVLPKEIHFITTSELEQLYPNLEPNQREYEIVKEYGAVFLMQIGVKLSNGLPHDSRAADYDDWNLNGDILLYYKELDIAFEVSSMGIRVDEDSLINQLKDKDEMYKINNPYIQGIINKQLPYTIGGGLGQSRICMFFLKKAHIGEVQASIWPEEDIKLLEEKNIHLL